MMAMNYRRSVHQFGGLITNRCDLSLRLTSLRSQRRLVQDQCRFTSNWNSKNSGQTGLTYDQICSIRTDQATRSVLILEPTGATSEHLYEYCRNHGPIVRALSFYRNLSKYTLVEYKNTVSVAKLLDNTQHFSNDRRIPFESRFLCLQMDRGHKAPDRRRNKGSYEPEGVRTHVDNFGSCRLTNLDLRNCKSISEQIALLYNGLSMTELDIRLRYFLCSEVEALVRKVLRGADIKLFGSSVSGLGRYDSDIDMVLDISRSTRPAVTDRSSRCVSYFMTKMKSADGDRTFSQRTLSAVSGMLDQLMPQVVNVRRILKARVPIIKFSHKGTSIDCDLCMENGNALDMARLLHYLTQIDPRVAPLIFTVRQWARVNTVTQVNPGPYLSNFMISLLVIFYLQTRAQPHLPALNNLCANQSGPRLALSPEISLLRSTQKSQLPSNTNHDLGKLLVEFFSYYSTFNFSEATLSLIEGKVLHRTAEPLVIIKEYDKDEVQKEETETTPQAAAMYIENPLDKTLNVCKNVDLTHVKQFQELCRAASSSLMASHGRDAPWWGDSWGLLTVLNLDPVVADHPQGLTIDDEVEELKAALETADLGANEQGDDDNININSINNNNKSKAASQLSSRFGNNSDNNSSQPYNRSKAQIADKLDGDLDHTDDVLSWDKNKMANALCDKSSNEPKLNVNLRTLLDSDNDTAVKENKSVLKGKLH